MQLSSAHHSSLITHHSYVQAAIDRARQLGVVVNPPVSLPPVLSQGELESSSLSGGAGAGVSGASAFENLIHAAAAQAGVDPSLVQAVAKTESNLNPNAVSPAGARGLMQLMPGTARSLGVADSFDPAQNLAGGATYLRQMLDRYDDDVQRALAAYNAGPGAVDRYGGVPPYAETQAYVQRVLGNLDQLA